MPGAERWNRKYCRIDAGRPNLLRRNICPALRVLEAKGLTVERADFIKWAETTDKRFDKVVMNPPFSEGRAKAHLVAAANLVKPGGRVVAILPASMRKKSFLPGWTCSWSGLISNEFDGTSVSVVMLKADRK
ncbi:class I SAM-dependent methyltransferase [Serratia fonticola]|uniref:class I SAM-dependent methyltransferase n=1 Tax=Serratia fonticola TaxID=47917 RepID=UPI002DBF11A9|nr:class I SAM-dependent methyltransferase [Serratia fonticola]MEB7886055.1 class I SAM-dependent methyltransferase [Serratia fonticola]